ncbi:hypothetical protein [Streptomyces sp. NPDC001815]|uniref:hypothetical protein n=1 Tax=Streptomyces sp. NPDC001815 TaxID=3154526 RepID=UPI00332892E6
MANEVAIPLLPCRSIDEITESYGALGFTTTYRQTRPNPCVCIQRNGLQLHLTKAMENAVVLGDSKNDTRQAARILDTPRARSLRIVTAYADDWGWFQVNGTAGKYVWCELGTKTE